MVKNMGLVHCAFILLILALRVSSLEIESDKVRDVVELSTDFEARLRKFSQRYNELYIFIKTRLKEYNEDQKKLEANPEKFLSYPLNIFLLNRRMGLDFTAVMENIKHVGKVFLELMEDVVMRGPTEEKLIDSYRDYLVMMKTEHNIQDLADGKIDNDEFRSPLKAIDCYFMGHFETILKNYDDANEWFSIALQRYDPIEGLKYNLKRSEIQEKIKKNENAKKNLHSEFDEDSTSIDVSGSSRSEEERYSDDISRIIENLATPEDIEKFKKTQREEL